MFSFFWLDPFWGELEKLGMEPLPGGHSCHQVCNEWIWLSFKFLINIFKDFCLLVISLNFCQSFLAFCTMDIEEDQWLETKWIIDNVVFSLFVFNRFVIHSIVWSVFASVTNSYKTAKRNGQFLIISFFSCLLKRIIYAYKY